MVDFVLLFAARSAIVSAATASATSAESASASASASVTPESSSAATASLAGMLVVDLFSLLLLFGVLDLAGKYLLLLLVETADSLGREVLKLCSKLCDLRLKSLLLHGWADLEEAEKVEKRDVDIRKDVLLLLLVLLAGCAVVFLLSAYLDHGLCLALLFALDRLELVLLDLLAHVLFSHRVDDRLLLLLNNLGGLTLKAQLLLKQLAVANESLAGVDLLLEGIRTIGELLLALLEAGSLARFALDEPLLFVGDPLCVADRVHLDLVLEAALEVFLTQLILASVQGAQFLLLRLNLLFKLVQLLLNVIAVFLRLLKLLADLLDFGLLGLDILPDHVHFFVDLLPLVI